MPEPFPPSDVERFYRAARADLRALDVAPGRDIRFGAGLDKQGEAVRWEAVLSPARAFALARRSSGASGRR